MPSTVAASSSYLPTCFPEVRPSSRREGEARSPSIRQVEISSCSNCSSSRARPVRRVGMTTSVRRSDGTPSWSASLGSISGLSTAMTLRFTKTMARSKAGRRANNPAKSRPMVPTAAAPAFKRNNIRIRPLTSATVPRYRGAVGSGKHAEANFSLERGSRALARKLCALSNEVVAGILPTVSREVAVSLRCDLEGFGLENRALGHFELRVL